MQHHRLSFSGTLRRRSGLHGAFALPVVIVLFLATAIMFLYANRAMIFDQMTSANQYRSTQAFEIADAGLEWGLSMLNYQGFIDTACQTAASTSRFKDKLVTADVTSGALTPTGYVMACVMTGTTTPAMTCSCPNSNSPTASSIGPVFALEVQAVTGRSGVFRLISKGCTDSGTAAKDSRCIPGGTGSSDGYATVSTLVGLLPGLATAPAATITAAGNVSWGSSPALGLFNTDVSTNGVTINAGGSIGVSGARVTSIPGSPGDSSLIGNDPSLQGYQTNRDGMFATFFNMSKAEYQASATNITCPNGACNTLVEEAINAGAQKIYVTGDMTLTGNTTFGTSGNPVILVVAGNIDLGGTMDITGVLYSASTSWDATGSGSAFIRGAVVVEGSVTGTGSPDFYYDPAVLKSLSNGSTGSFVRIAGGWKDF